MKKFEGFRFDADIRLTEPARAELCWRHDALSFAEGEAVIDKWITRFIEKLEEDDVRADCVADMDKAMRLKAFLRGQAESRIEVKNTLTLETLQRSHKEHRDRFEEELGEVAGGVLFDESNLKNDGGGDSGSPLH